MRYLVCTESRCEQLNLWDGTVPPSGTMHCQFCGKHTMRDCKPRMEYAHRSIASSLMMLLHDERIESALDEWKADSHHPQEQHDRQYGSIWSGEAWRSDCSVFDCQTPCPH